MELYKSLWRSYKNAFASKDVKDHNEALRVAVNSPSPRYWMSPREAARHISRIEKGLEPLCKENGNKRESIGKIYSEYKRLRQKRLFRHKSILFVATYAVNSPAPKYYISIRQARRIITEMRRGYYGSFI